MAECKHGMEAAHCTVCTPPTSDPVYVPLKSKIFEAAYEGECAGCPERIDVGDEVRFVRGDLYHAECANAQVSGL